MNGPGLVGTLLASRRVLRARIARAVRYQAPSVRLAADAELSRELDFLLSLFLRRISGVPSHGSDGDDQRMAGIGAAYAARSHPFADLLVAYRIRRRVIVDYVVEVGARTGSDPHDLRETVDLVLTTCHVMVAAITAGYHSVEPYGRGADQQRAEFVRGLLWGTLGPAEVGRHGSAYGVDPARHYLAMRARPAPGETIDQLARAHGFTFGRANGGGLGAVVDGDLVGFIIAPPAGPVPGVAGFGPPRPLARLDESFRMASRALETAHRHRLTGAHEFGRLGLLPAVHADGAVGNALRRRYLAPLGDTEFAVEVVDTLRVYLVQGMHIARTAELMCVHPNTVRYRIGRFEELVGVGLRNSPTTAFEVLWALEHSAVPAAVARRPGPEAAGQAGGMIATTRHQPASAPVSLTGRQLT
ncbi:MAG TPA: helix-turn-helix domain-containing protein [Mycobacteriales bacterium]|nr:helix-turn-helix domain-containing protein [Mycobacteriales bacterium]